MDYIVIEFGLYIKRVLVLEAGHLGVYWETYYITGSLVGRGLGDLACG